MANTSIATQQEDSLQVLADEVRRQHGITQDTAHRLSLMSLRQWEKALTGIVAFPTAVALSTAATVLYGTSVLERGFELFEMSVQELGRLISQKAPNGHRAADGERMVQ